MKRFLNFRFLTAVLLGAGLIAVMSMLSDENNEEDDDLYGEPDGTISDGEVSSFVD